MLPLLQNHGYHDRFDIVCYADTHAARTCDDEEDQRRPFSIPGEVTIGNSDTSNLLEIIRNDEIDILIDLAMHTRHNRMFMFTPGKPALAVQVTYLGLPPSTTGLAAI